ncbi:MAG: hypothetical protein JW760_00110 [Spirochaetales bacterium]|nr:hypothetical protein [Spirochaetales bacterium]
MAISKKSKETQKERLTKELNGLLQEMDEEDLLFLIKQAHVLNHNRQAEAINREIDELNARKTVPGVKAGGGGSGFTVSIETPDNGKTYHFIVNGRKHFLDTAETKRIVELCYRPPTKSAALKYLYQFFHAERDEILYEHKITSEKSPFFQELFSEVRARFSLK